MTTPASRAFSAPPRRMSDTNRCRKVLRECRDVERQEWPSAHGIDIRHAVGRGDGAVRVRIVDDRREEVGRDDQCTVLIQAPDSRVVRARESDEQIRECRCAEDVLHGAQYLRQRFRVEFRGSTRAGGETRQSNLAPAGGFLVHVLLRILVELDAGGGWTRPTARSRSAAAG